MEVEGNGAYVLRVSGKKAYFTHGVFVYLIHCHIEADVVRSGAGDILHDGVIGVAAHGVVTSPVAIQTEQDKIRFRQIEGKGSVRHHVDDEEAHVLCLSHQIAQGKAAITPEESFASTKEKYAYAHVVQLFHLGMDLLVRMDHRRDIVHGAVFTPEIAAVGQDDSTEYRIFSAQEHGLEAEACKIEKC